MHTKDEPDRKMDYYEEVTASFPDSAKIYAVQPAETSPDDVLQEDETVTAAPDVSGNAPQEDEDAVSAEAGNTETEKAEDSSVDMDALLRLGEKGNTTAQFTLGGMYYFGKGVEIDDGQAEYWLAKAAGNGDSHAAKLLKMLKKPRISPTKNEPAEPVKNEPAEPGRIPTELILEAVRKFWKYGKTYDELTPKQKQNLRKYFGLTDRSFEEERFCAVRCTTILDSCKEGFLVSDRHLYVQGTSIQVDGKWCKNAVFDLLTLQQVNPAERKHYFNLYYKHGVRQSDVWVSGTYEPDIIDFLRCILENRPKKRQKK